MTEDLLQNVDWGAASVDWGAPVSSAKNDELVLSWDDDNKGFVAHFLSLIYNPAMFLILSGAKVEFKVAKRM